MCGIVGYVGTQEAAPILLDGLPRWATHGEPNDINAHPQVSQSGLFAVVHNGIIENYALLRAQLTAKGYTFRSETDTEVVAQLLDYYYAASRDVFEAVNSMLSAVEGAAAPHTRYRVHGRRRAGHRHMRRHPHL